MSGDLWQMARNGTTLLPGEARKLALAYDRLREERDTLRDRPWTAAEHIAALVAMGAIRQQQLSLSVGAADLCQDVLILPPELTP